MALNLGFIFILVNVIGTYCTTLITAVELQVFANSNLNLSLTLFFYLLITTCHTGNYRIFGDYGFFLFDK